MKYKTQYYTPNTYVLLRQPNVKYSLLFIIAKTDADGLPNIHYTAWYRPEKGVYKLTKPKTMFYRAPLPSEGIISERLVVPGERAKVRK